MPPTYSNVSPEAGLFAIAAFLSYGLVALLHLIFASAVFSDARKEQDRGTGLFLVGPTVWFFATLVGGLLAVALYWAVHHSTLRLPPPPPRHP